MKILVTGAQGFIAKNLIVRLNELKAYQVLTFSREDEASSLTSLVGEADFIFHLAGVNRPKDESEFETGNVVLTERLVEALQKTGREIPVVLSSSIQAENSSMYGKSKKAAEDSLAKLPQGTSFIFRLPNVFGKWSRPNYNSAVATFCHNMANGLAITVNDPSAVLNLVYVDDVVTAFIGLLKRHEQKKLVGGEQNQVVNPVYSTTVGAVADQIRRFKDSTETLITEEVGCGLGRALHATYISFLKPGQFSYPVKRYEDPRGVFVEMLKTQSSGQFSFFTAHPGVTRGGHYHHTKTEKFLVIAGKARYRFRHILTNEKYELVVDSKNGSTIVETIPGWSHDITNIGDDELVVMLWANEIFDRENPDTIACEVY